MSKVLLLVAACLAATLVFAGSAFAAPGYVPAGEFGGSGTGNGQFDHPQGIAIDTNGRLLVVDRDESRIQVFDLDGSGGGSYRSKFGVGVLDHPYGIAVDRVSGDIYVSDAGNGRIVRFDSSYAVDSGYSEPVVGVSSLSLASPIALDQSDRSLLVGDTATNRIVRLDSSGAPVASADFDGADAPGDPDGRFTGLRDVAVDATGRILVVDINGGNPEEGGSSRLLRFSAAGVYDGSPGVLANPGAVTADPVSHDARVIADVGLLSPDSRLFTLVGDAVASSLLPVFSDDEQSSSPRSMTIDPATGLLYVATALEPNYSYGRGSIQAYKPATIATVAPSAALDPATALTATSVTLHGHVNPNGFATTYRFEYRKAGASDWIATPVPDADAADGVADVDVHADLSGLIPAQDYEYRLVAANGAGPTGTASASLTTPGVAPVITAVQATQITIDSAVLVGTVNPRHQATSMHFEYGSGTSYGSSTPSQDVANAKAKTVTAAIGDLKAGTTYHFRVVATNATGTTTGGDETFTTVAGTTDGRAYEMVSPLEKNGVGVFASFTPNTDGGRGGVAVGGVQLTPDGESMLFTAAGGLPGAESAPGFTRSISRRSASDWIVQAVDPPNDTDATGVRPMLTFAMSDDGERAIVYSSRALAPGGVEGGRNVYLRDLVHGTYELIATGLENWSILNGETNLTAVTPDLSAIYFVSSMSLTADTPVGGSAYEWRAGIGLRPISVQLPGASLPVGGGIAATRFLPGASPDGRRKVVQVYDGAALFLVEDGKPVVQVTASQRAGDDPAQRQPAQYMGASRDLSKIFFYSEAALTDDSAGAGLYRYDVETATLTDLLADVPGYHRIYPQYKGVVSADGSTIVFNADGAMAPGAGTFNLYMVRNGTLQFLGDLDDINLATVPELQQVSSDGRYYTIQSRANLTSYDSSGVGCSAIGNPNCSQIFVYDSVLRVMSCASCNPDGSPPKGYAMFRPNQVPGLRHISNVLTEDGMVAFESSDALLPQDVNGRRDVYTWRAGRLELISTGRGDADALFEDMSADGSTIAIATRQQLVGRDTDQLIDAYVARVGGGLASQVAPPPSRLGCKGADCQGSPAAPSVLGRAGSEELSGDGQLPDEASVPKRASRVAVRSKVETGSGVRLSVAVSGPGTLVFTGVGIKKVTKRVVKRGTVAIGLRLNATALKSLGKRGRLGVKVSVRFTPRTGSASRTSTQVTFKKVRGRVARAAVAGRAGR
jgi:sugar lactone lactonase YvrE